MGGILINFIDDSLGRNFLIFFSSYTPPLICGIDSTTSPLAEEISQLAAEVQIPAHTHTHTHTNIPQPSAERDSLSWRFNMVAVHYDMVAVLKNHIFSV